MLISHTTLQTVLSATLLAVSQTIFLQRKLVVVTIVTSQGCKPKYLSLMTNHGEAGTGSVPETWEAASSFDMAT
jgi:hypothetical protein